MSKKNPQKGDVVVIHSLNRELTLALDGVLGLVVDNIGETRYSILALPNYSDEPYHGAEC